MREGLIRKGYKYYINFVDTSLFKVRSPLPTKPKRALIFSNCANMSAPHVQIIKKACAHLGIELNIIGHECCSARIYCVVHDFNIMFYIYFLNGLSILIFRYNE